MHLKLYFVVYSDNGSDAACMWILAPAVLLQTKIQMMLGGLPKCSFGLYSVTEDTDSNCTGNWCVQLNMDKDSNDTVGCVNVYFGVYSAVQT